VLATLAPEIDPIRVMPLGFVGADGAGGGI